MKILLFGVAQDIVGERNIFLNPDASSNLRTVGEVRHFLIEQYPALKNLSSLALAVNMEYANENQAILDTDEIALIPPVSGG